MISTNQSTVSRWIWINKSAPLSIQDDSSYIGGRGMRRVVFWQDSNGSTFVMSHIGQVQYFISFYIDKVTLTSKVSVLTLNPAGTEHAMSSSLPLIVEECTVVYARSKFHHSAGGSVRNMRGNGQGSGGSTIVFRNITASSCEMT